MSVTKPNSDPISDQVALMEKELKHCWSYEEHPSPEQAKKLLETLNNCTEDLQSLLAKLITRGIPHDTQMEARITTLVVGLKHLLKIKYQTEAYGKLGETFNAYQRLRKRSLSDHERAKLDSNSHFHPDQRQQIRTNLKYELWRQTPSKNGGVPTQERLEYRRQMAEGDDIDRIWSTQSSQRRSGYGPMKPEGVQVTPVSIPTTKGQPVSKASDSKAQKKGYDARQVPVEVSTHKLRLKEPKTTSAKSETIEGSTQSFTSEQKSGVGGSRSKTTGTSPLVTMTPTTILNTNDIREHESASKFRDRMGSDNPEMEPYKIVFEEKASELPAKKVVKTGGVDKATPGSGQPRSKRSKEIRISPPFSAVKRPPEPIKLTPGYYPAGRFSSPEGDEFEEWNFPPISSPGYRNLETPDSLFQYEQVDPHKIPAMTQPQGKGSGVQIRVRRQVDIGEIIPETPEGKPDVPIVEIVNKGYSGDVATKRIPVRNESNVTSEESETGQNAEDEIDPTQYEALAKDSKTDLSEDEDGAKGATDAKAGGRDAKRQRRHILCSMMSILLVVLFILISFTQCFIIKVFVEDEAVVTKMAKSYHESPLSLMTCYDCHRQVPKNRLVKGLTGYVRWGISKVRSFVNENQTDHIYWYHAKPGYLARNYIIPTDKKSEGTGTSEGTSSSSFLSAIPSIYRTSQTQRR